MNIKLGHGRVAIVDEEDYERLSEHRWHACNFRGKFYAMRQNRARRTIYMAREILRLRPGDKRDVDHINADTLDNRKVNLRACSRQQHAGNMGICRVNTTGYKGVSFVNKTGKFLSQIRSQGYHFHRAFATAKEAAAYYDEKAILIHGEFARTNAMMGLLDAYACDDLASH